jgi:hypothetical protein
MSLRNHRAAATALIGVLAAGVPATTAAASSGPIATDNTGAPKQGTRDNPIDPAPGTGSVGQPPPTGGGGSTPQNTAATPATTPWPPTATLTPPATGDLTSGAQCGQVTFTTTLPTVITCGPVTITFNTITTTTTTTTVAAPITTANGSIATGVTAPPAVTAPHAAVTVPHAVTTRQRPRVRVKHLTTTRANHETAVGKRTSGTFVLDRAKSSRAIKLRLVRVRFAAHPSH